MVGALSYDREVLAAVLGGVVQMFEVSFGYQERFSSRVLSIEKYRQEATRPAPNWSAGLKQPAVLATDACQ